MENAYNRMLLVLKQCEGGIESGARTHDNRGITYLSEFGHTFLMHIKETIARAEQAQQAEPVNQQLIDALKLAKNSLVAFKFMPGPHNAWEENDEANLAAVDAAIAAAPQAATEGCGACGDSCPGQGCRLERESPPTCQTCNGKGMIGGLLPNGGGYDGGPCPDCNTPQAAATVPKAPTWYKRSDIVKALERMNYHTAIADELADWFMRHMQLAFNRGFYQAHGPAAATQMEELELWHLLERATGELTRRAAPHVWEQIAWTAGAEFIEQRRARLAAAQKGGA